MKATAFRCGVMPAHGPANRHKLIQTFRALGFDGPYTGTGIHPGYMQHGERLVTLPNPHGADIGINLLSKILEQAGVTRAKIKNLLEPKWK
jgi:predicted RNA binding protein YcfA (HicA-like mRNA interferase family)